MSKEEWRAVPGWEERYQVSSHGRVRSLDHWTTNPIGVDRWFPGKMLKPIIGSVGYPMVNLKRGTTAKSTSVHTLVLEAFVGPRPDGMHGCHFDGTRTNNHLDNLRWDTPAANAADTARHGTHKNSQRTHCKNGHPFDEANTYLDYKGRRVCIICNKKWRRERRLIKKAQKA